MSNSTRMKPKKLIRGLMIIITAILCCVIVFGCGNTYSDTDVPLDGVTLPSSSEPSEKSPNDTDTDKKPDDENAERQQSLISNIDETLWTDGNFYYEFNGDGSVTEYSVSIENSYAEIENNVFQWKYENELLYFTADGTFELVDIQIEDEKEIISSTFLSPIVRSDIRFASVNIVSKRNKPDKRTIAYLSGEFIFSSEYDFYTDENATNKIINGSDLSETDEVYAFPNSTRRVIIRCSEADFELNLHELISDAYVLNNGLTLPQLPEGETWYYGDTEFASINQILRFVGENSEQWTDDIIIDLHRKVNTPPFGICRKYYYYQDKSNTLEITSSDGLTGYIVVIVNGCSYEYEWVLIADEDEGNTYYVDSIGGTFVYENDSIIISSPLINRLWGLGNTVTFV